MESLKSSVKFLLALFVALMSFGIVSAQEAADIPSGNLAQSTHCVSNGLKDFRLNVEVIVNSSSVVEFGTFRSVYGELKSSNKEGSAYFEELVIDEIGLTYEDQYIWFGPVDEALMFEVDSSIHGFSYKKVYAVVLVLDKLWVRRIDEVDPDSDWTFLDGGDLVSVCIFPTHWEPFNDEYYKATYSVVSVRKSGAMIPVFHFPWELSEYSTRYGTRAMTRE